MNEEIIFEDLTFHLEFIEEIKLIYWNEWSDSLKKEFNINNFSEYNLDNTIKYFIGYINNNNNKKLICSIALTPNDLGEITELSPWLSYVYVIDEYRNKGIANYMINWFLNNIQIRPLYLWCKHPLEKFYNKFGFEIIEYRTDISIMKKN